MKRLLKKLSPAKCLAAVPAIIFLAFLCLFTFGILSSSPVHNALAATKWEGKSIAALTESFEGCLQENFYQKYYFINLNGLTARILGLNSLNERQRLANGHMTDFKTAWDHIGSAQNVIALNDFLCARNTPFLFVLAPRKNMFHSVEYAPGYEEKMIFEKRDFLRMLKQAGVDCLDLDAWYEENGWGMDDVFFRTDHHWKPEAALAAARCTMERLEKYGFAADNRGYLEERSWDKTVLPQWYLGSHGKRVGSRYAGVDDLSVYRPKFKTGYAYYTFPQKNYPYANLYDTLLAERYLQRPDYFGDNCYNLYMTSNFGRCFTTNTEAPNKKRILIVGDSFMMPYHYFLSTEFYEIYAINPSNNIDGSFAEYVEMLQPDYVLTCIQNFHSREYYSFGTDAYRAHATEKAPQELAISDTFALCAAEGKDRFAVMCSELAPNCTYTMRIASATLSGSNSWAIQLCLMDLNTNKPVTNRYLMPNSGEEQTWIFTTPTDDHNYAVYFYAGTKGKTDNVQAELHGLKMYTGVWEHPRSVAPSAAIRNIDAPPPS